MGRQLRPKWIALTAAPSLAIRGRRRLGGICAAGQTSCDSVVAPQGLSDGASCEDLRKVAAALLPRAARRSTRYDLGVYRKNDLESVMEVDRMDRREMLVNQRGQQVLPQGLRGRLRG